MAAAAGLRLVGRWTLVLIVLGGLAYDVDGGRLSPGSVIGFGGVAVALWRLAKVDGLARRPLTTAAIAAGVAGVTALGPALGRPIGPALAAVAAVASALALWTAVAGMTVLARQLPKIRRELLNIRRYLRLLVVVAAVLFAGHKGWEVGGAQQVPRALELVWIAAEVVTVVLAVALQLWVFRVFMALRAAAEMLAVRSASPDGGEPPLHADAETKA